MDIGHTQNHNAEYLSEDELKRLGIAFTSPVFVHKFCVIVGAPNITLRQHVRIDAFSHLLASQGSIEIGPHVHVGAYAYILGNGGVKIDEGCNISQGVRLYSANDDYSGESLSSPMFPDEFKHIEIAPIHIEKLCMLASGVIILPGVHMVSGAVVGAHSLVKDSITKLGIYAGCPAKFIKNRSHNYRELYHKFLFNKAS